MIVRLVVSHPLVEPWTLGSELVKTTCQETVFDALTLTVVLVVLLVAGLASCGFGYGAYDEFYDPPSPLPAGPPGTCAAP